MYASLTEYSMFIYLDILQIHFLFYFFYSFIEVNPHYSFFQLPSDRMLAAPLTGSNSVFAKDKVWSGPQITIDDWGITRLSQFGQVSP